MLLQQNLSKDMNLYVDTYIVLEYFVNDLFFKNLQKELGTNLSCAFPRIGSLHFYGETFPLFVVGKNRSLLITPR
jgi:hypothetical protein